MGAAVAEPAKKPKAIAYVLGGIEYDADRGYRAADYNIPAPSFMRRLAVLRDGATPEERLAVAIPGMEQSDEKGKVHETRLIPREVEGVFLEPVNESRRWRPVRIRNSAELADFHESDRGRQKAALESHGAMAWRPRTRAERLLREQGTLDPFFFDSDAGGGISNTTLLDTEFIPIIAGPFYKQMYIYDYLLMHARAFELVNYNALAAAAVKIMVRFVLGRGISFHIKDDQALQVWTEFWERNNMRNFLRIYARDLTWQGEQMTRYYSPKEGYTTVRAIDPSTCWEIVVDPEDPEQVYYYHIQYPCVGGRTRIACMDGTSPTIASLARRKISPTNPLWLYSYDEAAGRVVPGKATKCWRTGRKRCVRVVLDNKQTVLASFDHPFLLRDGRYVWAEKLQPGDALMPLYRRRGYEEVWHPGPARWQATHQAVAEAAFARQRRRGEVVHHFNHDRIDNRPENLAYMPKATHDAETSMRRWDDPYLQEQRAAWIRKLSLGVKAAWTRKAYEHVRAPRPPGWRTRQAEGVRRSWQKPDVRARRVAALRAAWAGSKARRLTKKNHKVVAVHPAGMHEVYDLQVERYHNFALAAGVFTHNTPYQIWVAGQIPVAKYIVIQLPPTQVQLRKINQSALEKRGRSDLLPALPWLKRFNDYYSGVTLKAVLEANLVWVIEIDGDQADVDAFLTNQALTQLPPPGGVFIQNKAVKLTATSAQLTAAGRSAGGGPGQQIASIVAASLNLPSEYFNIEGGTGGARATALVRTDPAVKSIEDRQQIIREDVEEMYDRVISNAIMAGRISRQAARAEPELKKPGDGNAWMVPPHDQSEDEFEADLQRTLGRVGSRSRLR